MLGFRRVTVVGGRSRGPASVEDTAGNAPYCSGLPQIFALEVPSYGYFLVVDGERKCSRVFMDKLLG